MEKDDDDDDGDDERPLAGGLSPDVVALPLLPCRGAALEEEEEEEEEEGFCSEVYEGGGDPTLESTSSD